MLTTGQHFAFNIWDFESAKAVIDAAAFLSQDVILQTSTGIYKKLPGKVFSDFVKTYSKYKGIHAWLNIDHCKDENMLINAVDSGWDMIMADGSSMPVNQNIEFTNRIASYAHKRNVMVEAEVGQVKGIEDDINVQQDAIASKDDIKTFLNETNIDFIAVAFGNAHGEYKVVPNLHYDLVEYTAGISELPFVVHGGSGLSDDVLRKLIGIEGVKKINISTDLKIAYKSGISKAITDWKQPIDANQIIHDEIMEVAISKMKLLSYKEN
ncbi:MAG: class II fructose-bisphosphate aldolase [Butyrivibrio sp.]|nr:class II fructose-bisphosphate aldolase [Butyrivibrio sp.]